MGRTAVGGGVISRASTLPRRSIGKPCLAGMRRGQRCTMLPTPSPATTGNTQTATSSPATTSRAQTATVASRHGSSTAATCTTESQELPLSHPLEGGWCTFHPQSSDSFSTETNAMTGSPFTIGMPGEVAEVGDGDDASDMLDSDFLRVFDDELGDSDIGIGDHVENADIDGMAENIMTQPPVDMSDAVCSHVDSRAHQGTSQRPAAVRKSPLSPPKVPVWRMLYIDPDVADPKFVAGVLGKAASQALGCTCVFDVSTDIVEALADVHGGAMWVYRGVFINESLIRHRKLGRGKTADTSIQGKHLAKFLRQVGMSRTRIVLLVAGGVGFDTADAGAHGLSAVLRKPFTRTGFWNILRGMYLGGGPNTDEASVKTSGSPQPCHGQHQVSMGSSLPEGAPAATETVASPAAARSSGSATAAVGGPATMHVGAPVLASPPYPACLGFTPFAHPIISAYHLGSGLIRPRQPQPGPQRKYTKIAPREEEETVAGLSAPLLDGTSSLSFVGTDGQNVGVAVDKARDRGGLQCSEGQRVLAKGDGGAADTSYALSESDGRASEAAPDRSHLGEVSVAGIRKGESKPCFTSGSMDTVCPDPPTEGAAAA